MTDLASGEVLVPGSYIPHRDGTNYNPSSTSPSFASILGTADRLFPGLSSKDLENAEVVMVVIGKLYKAGTPVSGIAGIVRVGDVANAFRNMGGVSKKGYVAKYNEEMKNLVPMNETPEHVTAIILRKA